MYESINKFNILTYHNCFDTKCDIFGSHHRHVSHHSKSHTTTQQKRRKEKHTMTSHLCRKYRRLHQQPEWRKKRVTCMMMSVQWNQFQQLSLMMTMRFYTRLSQCITYVSSHFNCLFLWCFIKIVFLQDYSHLRIGWFVMLKCVSKLAYPENLNLIWKCWWKSKVLSPLSDLWQQVKIHFSGAHKSVNN